MSECCPVPEVDFVFQMKKERGEPDYMNKKIMSLLLGVAVLLCLCFSAYAEENAPGIVINTEKVMIREAEGGRSEVVLFKGKTANLAYSIENVENANKIRPEWTSSDENIVQVRNGSLNGKGPGKAQVTCSATLEDGTVLKAVIDVSVEIELRNITSTARNVTVFVGKESEPVELTFNPEDAACRTVTWTSDNPEIATVNEKGVVKGVKAGKTKITATSDEIVAKNGRAKTFSLNVVVNQAAESILIAEGEQKIAKGKSVKVNAVILPEDTTNKKIQWTSADPKIAQVNNGTISARGVGTTTITAATTDGTELSASLSVTVYQAVTGIQFSKRNPAVTKGETIGLSVTVSPKDATNKKVIWKSSDSSIARVDDKGTVSGVAVGTCDITAEAADGSGRKATARVTVEPKIPLDAETFTRSGYFGYYYEFAVTFKNLTKTRTVKYLQFDLKYTYGGKDYTYTGFYTDSDSIGPGRKKKVGWWDQIGYRLSYCSNFRVYLTCVKYSDGTWDYFTDNNLIGYF